MTGVRPHMNRLWLGSGIALLLFAVSVVLFGNSNAIDCHPSCSWDQKLIGWSMMISGGVFAALTVAAIVASILRWRTTRSSR